MYGIKAMLSGCSDEIITDESPQVEQAAPSKPAPHPLQA